VRKRSWRDHWNYVEGVISYLGTSKTGMTENRWCGPDIKRHDVAKVLAFTYIRIYIPQQAVLEEEI
jgi:hypothetical protein